MTNKEYKNRREEHENAAELFTFEKWNGFSVYPSRMMDGADLKELKAAYKEDKRAGAFALDGMNNRAVIIPVDGGALLKSYNTVVAAIVNGVFYKTWTGFSVTTLKQVNAFRGFYGFAPMNKRAWIEQDTTTDIVDNETGVVVYAE